VAQAVLQTLQTTDLVAQTATRGEVIIAHLRQHLSPAMVREVRGRGFMIGLELRGKVAPILAELQARGVLALPAGPTVLRLLPPLVISDAALWQAIEIIIEVVGNAAE
jgi:acetylornithine/LysW-gamma-L-lysine aminotransferase